MKSRLICAARLEEADKINQKRLKLWNYYHEHLADLGGTGMDSASFGAGICHSQCAYVLHKSKRSGHSGTKLLAYLKEREILSVFHYVLLHSSRAGQMFGHFHGEDVYTTKESERLRPASRCIIA